MQKRLISLSLIAFSGVIILISCQKELSCENCAIVGANEPPIALAGPDQMISLPTDSISLNGNTSYDTDGTIVSYKWTKISGPSSANIIKTDSSKTAVKTLMMGVYQFELMVKDNGGLSANDTMMVVVNDPAVNQPPIADAGTDQTIALPIDSVLLNGNLSFDPDGTITTYLWTKISGPAASNIFNPASVQTKVDQLQQGIYQFELRVMDNGGLNGRDTVQVIVNPLVVDTCGANRPIINAQLIPSGTLSEARTLIEVASAGNKILFAGGLTSTGAPSAVVDIYDIASQSWSTAQLSKARFGIGAISSGNKIYLAGGDIGGSVSFSSRVDIYDVVTNSWSTTELSEARGNVTVTTIGSKIMFAGGDNYCVMNGLCTSDRVDIYDTQTNAWSIATLSVGREGMTATTVANKIYFAGGHDWRIGTGVFDKIDIYDNSSNTWSTSNLIERKAHHGSVSIGNYILWAGGEIWNNMNDYETTCVIEKRDLTTGISTIIHLFQPSAYSSNNQPGIKTLTKNGSVLFYTGHNQFDIYNQVSDMWSIGTMSQGFDNAAVIEVNNIIYIAGGGFPYYLPYSDKVWKLEF